MSNLIISYGKTQMKSLMFEDFYKMGFSVMPIKTIKMQRAEVRKQPDNILAGEILNIPYQERGCIVQVLRNGVLYQCVRQELEENSIIIPGDGLEITMEYGDGVFQRELLMHFASADYNCYGKDFSILAMKTLAPYIAAVMEYGNYKEMEEKLIEIELMLRDMDGRLQSGADKTEVLLETEKEMKGVAKGCECKKTYMDVGCVPVMECATGRAYPFPV